MPPLLNFIGGAAKYFQAAKLKELEGEIAVNKEKAKYDRKIKRNQKTFKVGQQNFTFNTGDNLAGTGSERASNGLIDIFNNMPAKNFQVAMIDPSATEEEKQNLFSFLTNRHLNWNKEHELKDAAAGQMIATSQGYKDVYSVFKNRLVPYGLAYARKIVNPSYSNAINDWVARHPELKGSFEIDKKHGDGKIVYKFASPLIDNSVYKNDILAISKKLNISPKETLRIFQMTNLDGTDLDGGDETNLLPFKIYRKLQKDIGTVTNAVEFTGSDKLYNIREEALKGGMKINQFMNLLQTLSPDMAAKVSPAYVFIDKSKQAQASSKYMNDVLKVDTKARGQAAGGALQAAITARNFSKTFAQIDKVGGQGVGTISAQGINKLMEAIRSDTGPISGVLNVFKNFLVNPDFRTGGRENNLSHRFLKKYNRNANDLINTKDSMFGGSVTVNGVEYASAKVARLTGYVEFMKFQLAYQMASALQGGTGGRTISDQDVENMLRSMNFDGRSDSTHIVASLERIADIMGELHMVNSFYAHSPQKAHAAYLYERANFFGGSYFTAQDYEDYVSKKLKRATTPGGPNYNPVTFTPIFDSQGKIQTIQ